eukprot:12916428-Ditylum_brightwellii.AAC.1
MSKFNEEKAREKECSNNHPQGRAVTLAQMLYAMLKCPEEVVLGTMATTYVLRNNNFAGREQFKYFC